MLLFSVIGFKRKTLLGFIRKTTFCKGVFESIYSKDSFEGTREGWGLGSREECIIAVTYPL